MAYSTSIDAFLSGDDKIVIEAQRRFKACQEWEGQSRINFEYDYKFAHGDSVNMFQWDNWVVGDRVTEDRPCLTINKTKQHNLQIVNDGKQNKPGVNIRPVGDTASFEAAQIYMEVCRHIEYISNAENIYDSALEFTVHGGFGYWRITTDYVNDRSFDQEIFIRRIKDPRSVYLDPDINEVDGSDARFGFIFTDKPKDLYEAEYPDDKDVGGNTLFNGEYSGDWYGKDHVRVCEYFRKTNKKDKYISFTATGTGQEIEGFVSELDAGMVQLFNSLKEAEKDVAPQQRTYRERDVVRNDIKWYKIAGNKIIERGDWLGKYIPIVRVIGEETIIDGTMDRVSHTRAQLDPQRIYNINSSANVEYGALQAKTPVVASADAVEGYEEYYKTANRVNHAWLPYNAYDETGRQLPPPQRMQPPQPSAAYVQQMQIAQNEMMMVTGQYQSQMGENENAKSGVAINARQRQGDRATYHFVDGLAIANRYTGKILIDLIPKIYDTKRIMRIEARDGSIINLTIDPEAETAFQKLLPDNEQLSNSNESVVNIIFNPNVGNYAVQSDAGPSFATRRQDAFNALTQIAAQNKEFMNVAGDILWKVADFPEAQVLAQRWRRIIPPNILGDAPNPQITEAMKQASDKIEQQLAIITKQTQELANKDRELDIKEREIALREKVAGHESVVDAVKEIRADFDALTKRITAIGNSGPAISIEQIQPLIKQTIREALINGGQLVEDDGLPGIGEGGTPIEPEEDLQNEANMARDEFNESEMPEGARLAPDGNYYVENPEGGFMRVENG